MTTHHIRNVRRSTSNGPVVANIWEVSTSALLGTKYCQKWATSERRNGRFEILRAVLTIQAHPNVSEDSLHLHDQQFMDKAIRLELLELEDEALRSCEHREPLGRRHRVTSHKTKSIRDIVHKFFETLGARCVMWSKFSTKVPYIHVLSATAQYLVATAKWRPEFHTNPAVGSSKATRASLKIVTTRQTL